MASKRKNTKTRTAPRDTAEAYAQAERADRDFVSVQAMLDRIMATAAKPATTAK